ncbi:MAG TPA: RluA family pseudouridine synthase [bacterium]|nr:RluA family pseudouridine synthase [bacterium]
MDIPILFEDNHLIAVDKPRGMPTQADRSDDPDLLTTVKEHLKERYRKPGAAYLGMVHRLDRPVGGVVLFAKTSKAASRLAEQLRAGLFHKTYLAVVRGGPAPSEARLEHHLLKDPSRNLVLVSAPGTPGSKRAILTYRVLATHGDHSLLSVELLTGRSHQIRVQLATVGHPIIGDEKYGPKSGAEHSLLALHAVSISFDHPVKHEPMRVSSPVPTEDRWAPFRGTIDAHLLQGS